MSDSNGAMTGSADCVMSGIQCGVVLYTVQCTDCVLQYTCAVCILPTQCRVVQIVLCTIL